MEHGRKLKPSHIILNQHSSLVQHHEFYQLVKLGNVMKIFLWNPPFETLLVDKLSSSFRQLLHVNQLVLRLFYQLKSCECQLLIFRASNSLEYLLDDSNPWINLVWSSLTQVGMIWKSISHVLLLNSICSNKLSWWLQIWWSLKIDKTWSTIWLLIEVICVL